MTAVSDEMFNATQALNRAEDRLSKFLDEVCGEHRWDSFTADAYDRSIEVYGCTTTVALERFAAAGFDRIWQHPHLEGQPARSSCDCRSRMLARYESAGAVRIIVVGQEAA